LNFKNKINFLFYVLTRIILKRREYVAATASGSEMKTENSMSRKVAPSVPIFFVDVLGKRLSLFLLLGSSMYKKMPNG
jgi:hypothetical protein